MATLMETGQLRCVRDVSASVRIELLADSATNPTLQATIDGDVPLVIVVLAVGPIRLRLLLKLALDGLEGGARLVDLPPEVLFEGDPLVDGVVQELCRLNCLLNVLDGSKTLVPIHRLPLDEPFSLALGAQAIPPIPQLGVFGPTSH